MNVPRNVLQQEIAIVRPVIHLPNVSALPDARSWRGVNGAFGPDQKASFRERVGSLLIGPPGSLPILSSEERILTTIAMPLRNLKPLQSWPRSDLAECIRGAAPSP
jgi:hypothetical protein